MFMLPLLYIIACSEEKNTGNFGPAEQNIVSDEGLYGLKITNEPHPPVTGSCSLDIELKSNEQDELIEAAVIELIPWMPAHGHGMSENPVVDEIGKGLYTATPVWTMPGVWEVAIEISGSAGEDSALVTYDVQ